MKRALRRISYGALFGLWMASVCIAGAALIASTYLEDMA